MDLINYVQNCRVCLKANNAYRNIFSHVVEGYQEPVVQILLSLFNIELNPHKAYPQFICRKCLTELENILLFKEDLVRNQEFLYGLFKAAYSEGVGKSDPDFFMLTEKINKHKTWHNSNLECDGVDKNEVVKCDSTPSSQVDKAAEQHAEMTCKDCSKTAHSNGTLKNQSSTYSIEQTQKDNNNVEKNKENFKTEHIETDENRNISCRVQYQEHQTSSTENDLGVVNKAVTRLDSHSEAVIPQISFLQKLDLITLEDAKNLKSQPKPLLRTRRRSVSKKWKLPKIGSTPTGNVQACAGSSTSARRKKQLDKKGFPDRLVARSASFLSRYGCRKFNKTYLKQLKTSRDGDSVFTGRQRNKNINKQNNKQVNKKNHSSLGPNSLFNKPNESKAVSKQKGCEHVNSFQNNNSGKKKSTSSSRLRVEVNNIRDYKRVDSLKDNNCDICPVEQLKIDKQKNIKHNMCPLEPSREIQKNVCNIKNADLLVESKITSSAKLYDYGTPGEYRPIPSKKFYESDSFIEPSYRDTAVEQSISCRNLKTFESISSVKTETLPYRDTAEQSLIRNLKTFGSMTSIKTGNSSVEAGVPNISDFNTTLFRSASLDSLLDCSKEIKKEILSIDDSRALVPNNVQNNDLEKLVQIISKLKSEPLTNISSGELSMIQPNEFELPKCFNKLSTTALFDELSQRPGEDQINLANSANNVKRNLRPKTNRSRSRYLGQNTSLLEPCNSKEETNVNMGIKSSPKSSEASPALRKKREQSKKLEIAVTGEACRNTANSFNITKNVDTNDISGICIKKTEELVKRELHDYCLRSRMSSTNTHSSPTNLNNFECGNISVENKRIIQQKLELEKTSAAVLGKQSCERTVCQRASRRVRVIRQKLELPEIKAESSDSLDKISELSRSPLLNKQSSETTICQPASTATIRQESEWSEIKTESSDCTDEVLELNRSCNENRTTPAIGIKSKVISASQNSTTGRKSVNSARLKTKYKKAVSSENLSILKYEAQGTKVSQKFWKTNIPFVNGYKVISDKSVFMGKVRKIDISEDDELHLTLVRTSFKQGETSQNIKDHETSFGADVKTKSSHELIRNKSYYEKSKSCSDLSGQGRECKRKISMDSTICSKRKRRRPAKYSFSYEKPRVFCYHGHIKELCRRNKK